MRRADRDQARGGFPPPVGGGAICGYGWPCEADAVGGPYCARHAEVAQVVTASVVDTETLVGGVRWCDSPPAAGLLFLRSGELVEPDRAAGGAALAEARERVDGGVLLGVLGDGAVHAHDG